MLYEVITKSWRLVDFSIISSFVLILFNGSLLYFVENNFKYFIATKLILVTLYMLFILYFWNYSFNLTLFLLGIVLLKLGKSKVEFI